MQFCLFEDHLFNRFHPLTLTRPVDDLRIGILTVCEKWERTFETTMSARITRPELNALFAAGTIDASESCLWINARYLPDDELVEEISALDTGSMLKTGKVVIAARAEGDQSQQWLEEGQTDFSSLMVVESGSYPCIEHLWDLFLLNGEAIVSDIALLNTSAAAEDQFPGNVVIPDPEQVYLEKGVTIEPGTVFHTGSGPVHIGKNATIQAGSLVRGPVSIGEGATVKMGAKIYGETTIGPVCKVGGEVHNTIFHSYANKAHDGFIGNSLVGQWCNLGADTNTSNLKNNYSTIRITDWNTREEVETGQQFIGTIMGDHTKTAINTQLNTGTISGVSCNIFSGEFPPKLIPSFSWVATNVIQPYMVDKAIETMTAMMKRRNVEMTEEYESLMRHIFKHRRD